MAEATEATVESVLLIPWEATEATEAATEADMVEATEATVESVLLIPWEATEATEAATEADMVEATEATVESVLLIPGEATAEATEAAMAEATANKPLPDNCRVKSVLSNVVSLLRVCFCCTTTLRCSSAINGSKCAVILRSGSAHQWRAS